MSTKISMTDAAYSCMEKRKREIEFTKLWDDVAKAMDIPPEQLARKKRQFYSELMMDRRFAAIKGNKWDLRSRRKFEGLHAADEDLDDSDDDTEDSDEAEAVDLASDEESY